MLWNDNGRSSCQVGVTAGKLALIALVVLGFASLGQAAPNREPKEVTRVYSHTYEEVFQASLDAIERMGLFATDKDKDKGTISGNGDYRPRMMSVLIKFTFNIHIEIVSTKPETRLTINFEQHPKTGEPTRFADDFVIEVQKVLSTYH